MSATMGTPASATIAPSARASPSWGTATRTMSAPWVARAWTWISVAATSSGLVMAIDWMETGAPPPMSTPPREIRREVRRAASMVAPCRFRAVALSSDQPAEAPGHRHRLGEAAQPDSRPAYIQTEGWCVPAAGPGKLSQFLNVSPGARVMTDHPDGGDGAGAKGALRARDEKGSPWMSVRLLATRLAGLGAALA